MFWLQDPIGDADDCNKESQIKYDVADHQVIHAVAEKTDH